MRISNDEKIKDKSNSINQNLLCKTDIIIRTPIIGSNFINYEIFL